MKSIAVSKLGSLTSLISSGSTPLGGATRYLSEGPVMFIRSQNVRMNFLDLSDVVYIDSALHDEMKRTHVRSGDVFINITGASIGRVAAFDRNGENANVNQHVCIIRPKSEILDFRYLTAFLCSPRFQETIKRLQHGGTRQAVTFDMIANFDIPLPSLPEQRRIAAILDKADAIRRKREEGIRLTEELLRSTFLEMFGDPATNPKGWATHPLQELVSDERPITYGILKPGPDTEGGIPYVRVVDIKNQRIAVDSLRRTTKEIAQEYRRSTLQQGDILMSIRGHVGRCAVVPQNLAGANITQDTARICPRYEWSRAYMFWSLHVDSIQNWMAKHVRGVAVKGINLGDVKRLPLPLPPKELCLKFDAIQAIANRQHDNRVRAFEQATSLFGSLVQRAFRGIL